MNINFLLLQTWTQKILRQNLEKSLNYTGKFIDLYPFQNKILQDWLSNKFNLVINSRQTGISSLITSHASFSAIQTPNITNMILAPKEAQAGDLLRTIKLCIGKEFILESTKNSLKLINGSRIIVDGATVYAGRGTRINNLYMMDFDFYQNREEILKTIIPTVSYTENSKIVVTSTPKDNDGVIKLEKSKLWAANRVIWSDVPVRDSRWEQDILKTLISSSGEDAQRIFKQEFECEII